MEVIVQKAPRQRKGVMQIFKEDNGNWSSIRTMFVIFTMIFTLTWLWLCIAFKTIQPIPYEASAIIGILAAGKAVQKRYEGNNEQATMDEN